MAEICPHHSISIHTRQTEQIHTDTRHLQHYNHWTHKSANNSYEFHLFTEITGRRTQQTSIHEIEKTETERNPASISRHKYRRKLATRIGLTEAGDTHRLDRSSSYIWQKGGVTQRLERTQFMYIIQSWWHSQTGQKSDSTHRLYRKLCHRSQAV